MISNLNHKKAADGYSAVFGDYGRLVEDVEEMEKNSYWYSIPSSRICLDTVEADEVEYKSDYYGLDEQLLADTAQGTRLIAIMSGEPIPVRNTGIKTIQDTAKIAGSVLERMSPCDYAETLTRCFRYAKGESLVLQRYGKFSACHSSGPGGYEIMPVSMLLDITKRTVEDKFGDAEFVQGYNSHSYTEAWWELPDARETLIEKYQRILEDAGINGYAINFMPTIHFSSSDTGTSCASLVPMFCKGERHIPLSFGVKIKHTKSGKDRSCMEIYADEIQDIYARFNETLEQIKELVSITVYNPENCLIGICRKLNIPKRYGEPAREELAKMSSGKASVTAHEIYIALTKVSEAAQEKGASKLTVNTLDESITKVAMFGKKDFANYDVGGVVPWKS